MKLYEDGKLDLDAHISKYLPEGVTSQIANGDALTVRQLLNHTTGLVNYVMKTHEGWSDNTIQSLLFLVTAFGHFGSVVSYSSLVYYFAEIETTIAVLNSKFSTEIGAVHMGNDIYSGLFD